MKKLIVLLVLLTLFTTCACSPARSREPEKITLIRESSIFRGFEVKGGYVLISCEFTLKNNTSETQRFKIKGIFKDDVKGGLLKEETIYANNAGYGAHGPLVYEFIISPNYENSFEVTFIGEFGGREVKHDRLLPEIEIEYLTEEQS